MIQFPFQWNFFQTLRNEIIYQLYSILYLELLYIAYSITVDIRILQFYNITILQYYNITGMWRTMAQLTSQWLDLGETP